MLITMKKSPNYTKGREDNSVDYVVIHYIVGKLAAADSTFSKPSSQVSAHYGIEDLKVHQYVMEHDTAWHAGNWKMNLRSIGIEHSADTDRPPSKLTYKSSIKLCARICLKYGIDPQTQIIPHSSVVPTLCPGTVDIQRIKDGVSALLRNL